MTTQSILAAPGTPVVFAAAGISNVLWTPQNEGAGKGRIAAVWDRGAGHVPVPYHWRATCRWVATPAANDTLRLWLVTASALADPTNTDGTFTLGDAELTSENELLANCRWFGTIVATAVDKLFVASGVVHLVSRYISLAGWNSSATKALTNTATDFSVTFIPLPYAIEAPL